MIKYGIINNIKYFSRTIKLANKAVWINVENTNGYFERVPAFEGESLWMALIRVNSKINGDCGSLDIYSHIDKPKEPQVSGSFCGNCHIIVGKAWFDKMERDNEIHPYEKQDIKAYGLHKMSRFACLVRVEKWMNEMKIKLEHDHQSYGTFEEDEFFD